MGNMLSVTALQKSRSASLLFQELSFTLEAGAGLGVSGHNGSGKTTLLNIIAGLDRDYTGVCQVNTTLGYIMQVDGFEENLSCLDNLLMEAALCRLPRREARSRVVDIAATCAVTEFLPKRVSQLSAGMRVRLGIAAALLPAPGLLLLDEAFSPLDKSARELVFALLRSLKKQGLALVLVSHAAGDFSGLCERVLTLPAAEVTDL
jgi:ABC-type multidrug transport system ATPase subunit